MNRSWRLVASRSRELEDLLTSFEPFSTVMSDRLLRAPLDRRLRAGGRFYLLPGVAAVYHGPGGFFYPVGLGDAGLRPGELPALRRQIGPFVRPHSIMGQRTDVDLLAGAFGNLRWYTVDYHLLVLSRGRYPDVTPPPHPSLRVVVPTRRDVSRLIPLQVAYEVEEVLLPGRTSNLAVSRATLTESLTQQLVLIAEAGGAVVARVATNARGVQWDQVGGVYTDPSWRGRGVAKWLMTHLLAKLEAERKDASLFVKTANRAAQQLYRGLGFTFESDFRISYYLQQ